MACKIIYKGVSYDESAFKSQIERYVAINNLFNENETLANAVYEALGFNQMITPNDRIVFGHPTIGKSFLKNQGEDKFISLDDDYATEINNKVKEIANKYNVTTYQVKDGGTQSWNNEYNQMMQEMFNVAKQKAISENKTLFTSNTNLLRNNAEFFDKVINLTDKEFERRIQERGAKYDTKEWKSQINEAISKLPTNKIINTDKYLSDLFITPQQKQQAQQLYSQYLDQIFPDSKVKDIVYHFSKDKNKQDFRDTKSALSKETDGSIHFGTLAQAQSRESDIERELFESQWDGTGKKTAEDYAKELYNKNWNELTVDEQGEVIYLEQINSGNILLDNLANIKSGKIYSAVINADKIKELPDRGLNNFSFKDVDTIKYLNKVEAGWNPDFSFAVNNPKQIHILGSKQDIDGFRNFVNTTKKESESAEQIYSKLGDKTQSENVVIKPWNELKLAPPILTKEIDENSILLNVVGDKISFPLFSGFGKITDILKNNNNYTITIEGRFGLHGQNKVVKANFIGNKFIDLTVNKEPREINKDKIFYLNNSLMFLNSSSQIISTRQNGGFSNYSFGNLYTSDKKIASENSSLQVTDSTEESVKKYIDWIINSQDERAIKVRRLINSGLLKGKPILYYKELGEPSHATALDYLINKYDWDNSDNITNFTEDNNNIREEDLGLTDNLSTDDFKC